MAIKKNTDKNLNTIKKDGITDSYEKEGFFKDKQEIIEEKNIKIAQALDQVRDPIARKKQCRTNITYER